ncbi:MAG: alpha/beta hydrolase [Oleibacter sp.]|nr:alpha/beta hydrolase [Thalassolituus sp.]
MTENTQTEAQSFIVNKHGITGLTFAQTVGQDSSPVLALHGWLDNAESFRLLSQQLPEYSLLCPDLPGHGLSHPLPQGCDYLIWSSIGALRDLLDQYAQPINVIGHSMGGSLALFLAAAYPECVRSVCLIDSAGPLTAAENTVARNLRESIEWQRRPHTLRTLASLEEAVHARLKVTPGLTQQEIQPLVQRNLMPVADGFKWRTDMRLRKPSALRLSESQAVGLLAAIQCPVLALRAEQGLLPQALFEQRLSAIPNITRRSVQGFHHTHMHPQHSVEVAEMIRAFIQ